MTTDSQPVSSGPRALLAEDDELIREIVAHYLERLGYEVTQAPNGRVAVAIIEQLQAGDAFDLVVTDSLMPKAGGEAVIEAACLCQACQRFLVISGFTPELTREVSRCAPHSGFLAKPFTFDAFRSKVHELSGTAC